MPYLYAAAALLLPVCALALFLAAARAGTATEQNGDPK